VLPLAVLREALEDPRRQVCVMEISVNGQHQQVADGTSLADLLAQLKLNRKLVAVEVNTQLVPRERHGECVLQPGDQLEIVTLVGGG
jgi:thiamine biosynthesis protein ThiS